MKNELAALRQRIAALEASEVERVRVEEALRESEERYRTLVENQGEGIGIVDTEERFIFANPAAHEIFGVLPDSLPGRNLKDFIDEEEFAIIQAQTELRRTGQASVYEFEFVRPDGQRRSLLVTATPQFDQEGQFSGTFGIFRDITERKQAKETLERRVNELSALNTMAAIVSQSLEVDEILDQAIDQALSLVGVEAAGFYLVDESAGELRLVVHRGLSDKFVRTFSPLKPGEGISGKVVQTDEPVVLNSATDYPGAKKTFLEKEDLQSAVIVPLHGSTGVIGTMNLATARLEYFDPEGVELLMSLGQQIATGVEKARLYEETCAWAAELEQRVEERTADLAASEARYHTLFDNALDAITVIDMQGRYLDVNPAACQLFGYNRQELLAMDISQIRGRDIPPEEQARLLKERQALWRQGASGHKSQLVTKTGELVDVEITITPLTYDGQKAVLGVIRDITERMRAEEQRRYQANLLRNVSDAVFSTDLDFNIQSWNKAAETIYGWQAEEVIGQPMAKIVPTEYPYDERDQVVEQFFSKGFWTGEVIQKREDGTNLHILASVSLFRDNAGEPAGIVAVNRDISKRARAEEALQEYSERLEEMVEEGTKQLRDAQEQLIRREKLATLGQLAGGVAHELRNPLGAIKNVAYFLDMNLDDSDPELKKSLQILHKQVGIADEIISSLLDFARSKPTLRQQVDVNDVVREVLSRTTVPGNVEVVSRLDKSQPVILADSPQLRQVFDNLIRNAIQAMSNGGQLTIKSVVDSPGWLAISFADTGQGIPKENMEKLFEPLFTTKAKGIGLGLALVKTLVEGNGGIIEVQSDGVPGNGSTFTVKLPLKKPAAEKQKSNVR